MVKTKPEWIKKERCVRFVNTKLFLPQITECLKNKSEKLWHVKTLAKFAQF